MEVEQATTVQVETEARVETSKTEGQEKPKKVYTRREGYISPSRIKDKLCPVCQATYIKRESPTCKKCIVRPGRKPIHMGVCQIEGCGGRVAPMGYRKDGSPVIQCYVCRKVQDPRYKRATAK